MAPQVLQAPAEQVVDLPEPWRSAAVTVVLPTYNEVDNLPVIVAELLALHAATSGGDLTATRVAELTSDLEGMRAGLAEAEQVSRSTLAGGQAPPISGG